LIPISQDARQIPNILFASIFGALEDPSRNNWRTYKQG
jgi:hypothetical protein